MAEFMNQVRGANEWEETYGNLGVEPPSQFAQLPLNILVPWSDPSGQQQPFKPYAPDKLEALAESIRKIVVIEAICVRPMANGRFHIVAGHIRVAASKLAGLTVIPAIVRQMDDNEAALRLVDSNLQHREKLLYSEKAFAYKMRLEAIKRQGKRTDLTSRPLVGKLDGAESANVLGAAAGESGRQVQRYIRLTELIPPLLALVDQGKFALRAAVEVSYLDEDAQAMLLRIMEEENIKPPSMAQAAKLREQDRLEQLNEEAIETVMLDKQQKANAMVKISIDRVSKFFPPNTSAGDIEQGIYEALAFYYKHNTSVSD